MRSHPFPKSKIENRKSKIHDPPRKPSLRLPPRLARGLFRGAIVLTILAVVGGTGLAAWRGRLPYTGLGFLGRSATPLANSGANWQFALQTTPTPLADGGANGQFALQTTPTPLANSGANWQFALQNTPIEDLPVARHTFPGGVVLLSLKEGNFAHLFAFHPTSLPLTRLTNGLWDDVAPALSPDARRVAFASNRGGPWDLYMLDLDTGLVARLTSTPEYEGAPTWSPDGQFLAYERFGTNFDIYVAAADGSIDSVDAGLDPIQLTNDLGADYAPAWSPLGRQIAFVSTRSGEPEIWLADLDNPGDDRFANLSRAPGTVENHPAWRPDGLALAWASNQGGLRRLMLADLSAPGSPQLRGAHPTGAGDWPVWNAAGDNLLTALETPNQTFLTAFVAADGLITLPVMGLNGPVKGLAWGEIELPRPLPAPFLTAAQGPTPVLWRPSTAQPAGVPGGRQSLTPLTDVVAAANAPRAELQAVAADSFAGLRSQVAAATGWDFLDTLQNAFVPLTVPLPPGMGDDWLYTGRAIAVNPAPLNAGWLKVVREDFGYQTYWRLYLRARFQDGTQGAPLPAQPWGLNARYTGSPAFYEQGGRLETPPTGYWVDFTEIARAYGWERQPALLNWRTFYPGTRFDEFALTMGLDWQTAILELYPPEVLITPTAIIPLSGAATPSATPTLSGAATPTPTKTLVPSRTPTPTKTPVPSLSGAATPTPAVNGFGNGLNGATPTRTSDPEP